ncbi:MAG: hypothetical protein ACK56F_04350 [bacterium]
MRRIHTEITYIDSSPVPACHGLTLVVPACLVLTEKRSREARRSTCAGL